MDIEFSSTKSGLKEVRAYSATTYVDGKRHTVSCFVPIRLLENTKFMKAIETDLKEVLERKVNGHPIPELVR